MGTLFVVPPSALVNVKTLTPLHPGSKYLSAHQLISLHLYLRRPLDDTESTDDLFGPFISILPREFDSHPLTWFIHKELGDENELGSILLALLPHSARSVLDVLVERFERDLDAVTKYLVSSIRICRNPKLMLILRRMPTAHLANSTLAITFGPG